MMKNMKNMKTSSLCWRSHAGLREESQVDVYMNMFVLISPWRNSTLICLVLFVFLLLLTALLLNQGESIPLFLLSALPECRVFLG